MFCVCVWAGASWQAQDHDGGIPQLQGEDSAAPPGTEEPPSGAQRRSDRFASTRLMIVDGFPAVEPKADVWSPVFLPGVDTDELDSNVDDWEEETIEFFINEEIIPIGDL